MALAILIGLVVPPCVVTAVVSVQLNPQGLIPPDMVRRTLLSTFATTSLVSATPGVAAWWIAQRLRPNIWIVAATGSAVAAAALGATYLQRAVRTLENSRRVLDETPAGVASPPADIRAELLAHTQQSMTELVVGMTALGAVVGGLTAIAMYLVAFPRSLRTAHPRDHF